MLSVPNGINSVKEAVKMNKVLSRLYILDVNISCVRFINGLVCLLLLSLKLVKIPLLIMTEKFIELTKTLQNTLNK